MLLLVDTRASSAGADQPEEPFLTVDAHWPRVALSTLCYLQIRDAVVGERATSTPVVVAFEELICSLLRPEPLLCGWLRLAPKAQRVLWAGNAGELPICR